MTNDEFQKICCSQFVLIHEKLDSLDDAFRGKDDRPGVNQRLGTLETDAGRRKKFEWVAITVIVGLIFTVCTSWILGGIKIG